MPPADGWYQELKIQFPDGTTKTFYLHFTRSGRLVPESRQGPAPWTRLAFHKCACCPLSEDIPVCPAANSLESTLLKLQGHTASEVVTASAMDSTNRLSQVKWPLQQVGSAFVQLAVFSSGCPIGDKMRSYINDLRPFSTTQELIRHIVGKLLIKHRGAVATSMKEIRLQLEPLHTVFKQLSVRLTDHQIPGSGDAVPNSIARMDAFAHLLDMHLEQVCAQIGKEAGWDVTVGEQPPAQEARPGLWQRLRAALGF